MSVDRAGRDYWDQLWSRAPTPATGAFDPSRPGLANFVNRSLDAEFRRRFAGCGLGPGTRSLEIGCAQSHWLAHFGRAYRFDVTGLDYSEVGCRRSRELLERAGVRGEVVQADLFDPPARLVGAFDLVFSRGVVEHFEDTAGTLRAFARFARPGGFVVTTIPNLAGMLGGLQKVLYRPVYDVHVPLDADDLARGHEDAGLAVRSCDYFLFANIGMLHLGDMPRRSVEYLAKRAFLAAAGRLNRLTWMIEERVPLPPNRTTSPFIVCVAEKRA
jgi:SAM-dependent methyltransferase